MAKLVSGANLRTIGLIAFFGLALIVSNAQAQATADRITTFKDENGWKLQRNGEDFYIKGVVWGYSPQGETYTYNLWGQSDEFIRKVLDHDFSLMQQAGINAIRTFSIVPPKWVTYIYENYGIMTLVNPLMGRYGANIGGIWQPNTNYSDPLTRNTLKAESLAVVETYKDVPGVLMFAFGNESNYGLSWSSFEIEDLPVGEQNREKAKFLYSLWGEVIREAKQIAPEHLFTIVNGDIQYIDLIAEYVPEQDLLGTNVYRGISFGELWKDVAEQLDKPIVFMEFGSDAFNAKNFAEDQGAQASFLKGQWQEMYNQTYAKGYGNALGGFVFEWRDEWWKTGQTENLDIQDRTASWSNGGYTFDYVEGQNNMNEEWFGIVRLGEINDDGVYVAEPRMAYDVLSELWSVDPYTSTQAEVNTTVQQVDMEMIALKAEVRELRSAKQKSEKFQMVGGRFQGDFLVNALENEIDEQGEDALEWDDGQMLFLDFAFQPNRKIKGDFSVNILGNVSESAFEFRYGDRGLPYTVEVVETSEASPDSTGTVAVERSEIEITDNNRFEIYDFQASYTDNNYELLAFYHTPRYHWGNEGDFFGLLRETTDMEGQDIWNAKAPYGVEYAGKEELGGLKVVAGPEVYWGANPKALIKYQFGDSKQYAFLHSEDLARAENSASATAPTERQTRQTTLYGKYALDGGMELEVGGIIGGSERIDERYTRLEGDDIVIDEIKWEDTLGFKGRLGFPLGGTTRGYVGVNYAGLVANGGDPFRDFGTELPYSALGNKREIEGGVQFTSGDYMFFPRFLWRDNLVDANPLIEPSTGGTSLDPGLTPRDADSDPFAVLDNREAQSLEFFMTYDPTPGTFFYNWDVDMREDAPFAYNIGLTATRYPTDTDAYLFFFEEGGTNASFGEGLEAEDVWQLKSKMIFNSSVDLKQVYNFAVGRKQSTGQPNQETVEFASVEAKLIANRRHIYSGWVAIDDFGPYDFQRQFNIVYPLQLRLEYSYLLDQLMDEKRSSKVGVKLLYRTLDELSPEDEYQDGLNSYMTEIQTYYAITF